MQDTAKNNDLRSIEIQEILGYVPKWTIRWGISTVFLLIMLFLFTSWLIKYPDVIKGEIEISTNNSPVILVSKTSGRLKQVLIDNNQLIKKEETFGIIENSLTEKEKEKLEEIIKQIDEYILNNKLEYYKFYHRNETFGIAQEPFSKLKSDVLSYCKLINESNISFQINNLTSQINNYNLLVLASRKQLNIQHESLKRAKERFDIHKNLYDKNMISKLDFFEKEEELNKSRETYIVAEKNIIELEIIINNLNKELNHIEFDYSKKKKDLLDQIPLNIASIKNTLLDWELNYHIKSPINGKLIYLDRLNNNQFINPEQKLCAVIPNETIFIGYIKVNQLGFGKIKLNQQVKIKLNNYPYQEYGQLSGIVTEISSMSINDNYLIKIKIPKGMNTTYNKEINYIPEMKGDAEIITDDLRLIERIFNQFKGLI